MLESTRQTVACSANPNLNPVPRYRIRSRNVLAVLVVAVFVVVPVSALPILDVDIVDVRPLKDDAYVYMTVAGTEQGAPALGRLAIDYYLRNDGDATVRIDHVTLNFDSPNIASIELRDNLAMWCPWPRPTPAIPPLTVQTGLDLDPGVTCRLGLLNDPHLDLPTATRLQVTIYYEFGGFQIGRSDVERDLVSHTNPTPTGSYRLPLRHEDLEPGEYLSARSPAFFGSHRFGNNPNEMHAYDMGVGRWDKDARVWTEFRPFPAGQIGPTVNEDYLVFGMPVYAMADGIVDDCESGWIDDAPGFEPQHNTANAFTITHGDEVAWYGHLAFGSVNQSICFDGAVVQEGQYLGDVGNSGNGSAPHLHIGVSRANDAMPLHFNDAFVLDRNVHEGAIVANGNMPWARVSGHGLPKEETILWPSGLRRRGDLGSGIASVENVLTKTSASRTVTTSRTPGGNVQTLLWRTDDSGDLAALDGDTGGAALDVSLATPTSSQDAALAVITGNGALKLIAYDVAGNTLTRAAEHTSNAAQAVVASPAPFTDGVMTAIRTQGGNFKIIAWEVDAASGIINRRGAANGGAVQAIALAPTLEFEGVVAAVQTSSGHLKLLTFDVPFAGFWVQRADDYQDDEVSAVSITRLGLLPGGEDLVVTACRTAAGTLELIAWSIDWHGDITRLGDAQAGAIGEVTVARIDGDHVLTTVTDSAGDLKLVAWHVASDGTIIRRTDLVAGAASALAQSNASSTHPSLSFTAISDSNGELKLMAVEDNLID